jgi:hypothetical protein
MTPSLADELNARAVDTDGVHQALRYYLAELLDDLPPEDMVGRMYDVAGQARVDTVRTDLMRDSGCSKTVRWPCCHLPGPRSPNEIGSARS